MNNNAISVFRDTPKEFCPRDYCMIAENVILTFNLGFNQAIFDFEIPWYGFQKKFDFLA